MKTLLLFLLAYSLMFCHEKSETKKEAVIKTEIQKKDSVIFHVKVAIWGYGWWKVVFTDDDFITEIPINDCWRADYSTMEPQIVLQVDLFDTKNEAVNFAKQFKTLQSCIDYNLKMQKRQDKLLKQLQSEPPKIIVKEVELEVDIKEVLIY
jgi:hypothetical protein